MAKTYRTLYGFDWPATMTDDNIRLVIAKKWREYKDIGVEFKDPWVPLIDAAKHLYGDEYLKVSEWTEQHFHDWVTEPMLITWGCASSGKGFLLSQPVCFRDRVGTVGEVRVGDEVMASTGNPVRVTGVYDHKDLDLYRVSFVDGSDVVCDENHLWTVSWWGRVRWEKTADGRRAVCGQRTATKSVSELAGKSPGQLRRMRVKIPLTSPVRFDRRPVPLDPYVLGCLLGNGSMTGSYLSFSSAPEDSDVRDEMARRLEPDGVRLVRFPSLAECDYRLTGGVVSRPGKRIGVVREALQNLGLWNHRSYEKFVPEVYKTNDLDTRLDVLAGLMDTDGHVSKEGSITYSTSSPALAEDVRFLARSVGACVTVASRDAGYTARDGARVGCRRTYRVTISRLPYSVSSRLFKLGRKRARIPERGRRADGYKHILSVEKITDRGNYPRETRCISIAETDSEGLPTGGLFNLGDFTVTHNSNDTGALIVLDWITDPFDTVTLVGSTTRDALRIRTWESIERYFKALKNLESLAVPGKLNPTSCFITNDRDLSDDPNAQGAKAGVHGVALNDGGKLQGAHLPYVRLVIDELATIYNHQDILSTIENLSIARDFKFVGLANPESWSNPSCQYAIPEGGVKSVDVDTGSWRSTFGCFVRHHDGLKSPCVRDPSLASRFPFLTQKRHIEASLKRAGGNADAPHFWKMVRGFPLPVGNDGQTVLDEAVAHRNMAMEPALPFDPSTVVAVAAGIDPAWSESGDHACYAKCYVRRDAWGKLYLDFTNGLRRLTLNATEFQRHPAVEQMRNQVTLIMREPYSAPFRATAVDSSGNQGLADDLVIYCGASDIMQVNFSVRASELPLRAHDPRPVKDIVYDRGTEAWCVLSEFVRAGMVRGLPQAAVSALTSRRFAARMVKDSAGLKRPAGVMHPLRMEPKDEFKKHGGGHSPDECDACALAALAVKERLGLMPFGFVADLPKQAAVAAPGAVSSGPVSLVAAGGPDDDYGASAADGDECYGAEALTPGAVL